MLLRTVLAMESLAIGTHDRITSDRAVGLEPREETLTQNLVSGLRASFQASGARVFAREIPRYEESTLYGADLALWFQDTSGALSGTHFQAKRQYKDDTYRDLDHSNKTDTQYDLLVTGARTAKAAAAYMFYNGLSAGQPARSSCCVGELSPDSHGVNVAPARALAGHLQGRVRRTDVEAACVPLRCIIGCEVVPRRHLGSELAAAHTLWKWMRDRSPDLSSVSVADAPGYLAPLLTLARDAAGDHRTGLGNDEPPPRDDVPDDLTDDGGRYVTALLVTQA